MNQVHTHDSIETLVTCRKCGQEKPPTDFYSNRAKQNGRESWCRKCVLAKKRHTRFKKLQRNRYLDKFSLLLSGEPDARLFVSKLRPVLEN